MKIMEVRAEERVLKENLRRSTALDDCTLHQKSFKSPDKDLSLCVKDQISSDEAPDKNSIDTFPKREHDSNFHSVVNAAADRMTLDNCLLQYSKDDACTNCMPHRSSETSDRVPSTSLEKDLHKNNGDIVIPMHTCNAESGFDVIPILLKFVDVAYSVPLKEKSLSLKDWSLCGRVSEKKEILHGVTGYVLPGELLALMGPSGSGKTTLINLLSGRKSVSKGVITYNDLPYSKTLKRRMGFVMQDDILHPHLTVLETLQYGALLRLPRSLSKADKLRRTMEVISLLGLESCQDTIIGDPTLRGISGGERKRVSVGNEILTDPSLLFLDEPTSGLDSTIALRIVQILHEFSRVGRSVVTTIHQPSSRLFYMFDKLILLSEGRIVYFGEARSAMEYFSSIQFSPLIAMNPADFLLDLANGNLADMSLPSELEHKVSYARNNRISNLSSQFQIEAREYITHTYEKTLQPNERNRLLELCVSSKHKDDISRKRKWSTPWWLQFKYLCIRGFKAQRHEVLSWLRITQVIASALIVGSLWQHSSSSTGKQLTDQIGLLFFMSTFWTFFPLFTAIFSFPTEKAILAKERASDMYRLSAYFLARTLSDIMLDICLPIAFLLIVYFMATLRRSAATFVLTFLTIFINIITAQGLGIAVGAALMNVKKATVLGSIILLAFMLAGGFFVQHLPVFIAWMQYFSINHYSFKLLVKVQYEKDQNYGCQTSSGCESIAASPALHGIPLGGGGAEAMTLIAMAVGYHLLAYFLLSRMKLSV